MPPKMLDGMLEISREGDDAMISSVMPVPTLSALVGMITPDHFHLNPCQGWTCLKVQRRTRGRHGKCARNSGFVGSAQEKARSDLKQTLDQQS